MPSANGPRPARPPCHPDHLPQALRDRAQWVVWKFDPPGDNPNEWAKVPFQPRRPDRKASSTNPQTWGTYAQAVAAYRHAGNDMDGVGFVFTADDAFAGADFDDCIQDGAIAEDVDDWLTRLDSYSEISPSGKGIKVVVAARHPGGEKHGRTRELYDTGRYFCLTGNRVAETPPDVQAAQDAYDALHRETFPPKPPAPPRAPRAMPAMSLDDADLLRKAQAAKNGRDFAALWHGDASAHDDNHSAADFDLCCRLAFWTNGDAGQMDRLFRQSGLLRDKWDERRGAGTYGTMTIDEAILRTPEGYTPLARPMPGPASARPAPPPAPWEPPPPFPAAAPDETFEEDEEEEGPVESAAPEAASAWPGERGCHVYQRLSTVIARPIDWLWEPYIARGKVTLLDGDPGVGKSYITLALATALSRGVAFPNSPTPPIGPAPSLLYVTEDDMEDTVRPRLDAMGADCDLIVGCKSLFNLDPMGFYEMEEEIAALRPALVVFDPMETYLAHVDLNKANDVRPLLLLLGNLAAKYRFAALAMRHLNKANGGKAIYRGLGSIAFNAVARSVLMAGREESTGQRALMHTKANGGPIGDPVGYDLTEGVFTWTGPCAMTAAQLIEVGAPEEVSALAEACAFLREVLMGGPMQQKEIESEARAAGISKATLVRAKAKLGVSSHREFDSTRFGVAKWTWSLTAGTDRDA